MHLKFIPQRFIFMRVGKEERSHLDPSIVGEFGDEGGEEVRSGGAECGELCFQRVHQRHQLFHFRYDPFDLLGGVALGLAVALPEFVVSGKPVEGDFAGHGAADDGAIVLQKRVAVRAVGKGDVENLRVFKRLLHPGTAGVVVVLPLDDGEREVRPVVEQVVGL